MSVSGMRMLIAMTEEVQGLAARAPFPPGVVELIRVEYALLGELVNAQAKVFGKYHERCSDPIEGVPMPEIVLDAITAVQTAILKAGAAADKIVPLALKVCADKLALLDDPRYAMYDQSRNPGGSGL